MALTAETKSWMVDYGLHCNRKYRTDMENIFTLVDEAAKKLNRPIKDLDDIRIAMASLKEIREQQISIDFQVGPIEVGNTNAHFFQRDSVGKSTQLSYLSKSIATLIESN